MGEKIDLLSRDSNKKYAFDYLEIDNHRSDPDNKAVKLIAKEMVLRCTLFPYEHYCAQKSLSKGVALLVNGLTGSQFYQHQYAIGRLVEKFGTSVTEGFLDERSVRLTNKAALDHFINARDVLLRSVDRPFLDNKAALLILHDLLTKKGVFSENDIKELLLRSYAEVVALDDGRIWLKLVDNETLPDLPEGFDVQFDPYARAYFAKINPKNKSADRDTLIEIVKNSHDDSRTKYLEKLFVPLIECIWQSHQSKTGQRKENIELLLIVSEKVSEIGFIFLACFKSLGVKNITRQSTVIYLDHLCDTKQLSQDSGRNIFLTLRNISLFQSAPNSVFKNLEHARRRLLNWLDTQCQQKLKEQWGPLLLELINYFISDVVNKSLDTQWSSRIWKLQEKDDIRSQIAFLLQTNRFFLADQKNPQPSAPPQSTLPSAASSRVPSPSSSPSFSRQNSSTQLLYPDLSGAMGVALQNSVEAFVNNEDPSQSNTLSAHESPSDTEEQPTVDFISHPADTEQLLASTTDTVPSPSAQKNPPDAKRPSVDSFLKEFRTTPELGGKNLGQYNRSQEKATTEYARLQQQGVELREIISVACQNGDDQTIIATSRQLSDTIQPLPFWQKVIAFNEEPSSGDENTHRAARRAERGKQDFDREENTHPRRHSFSSA